MSLLDLCLCSKTDNFGLSEPFKEMVVLENESKEMAALECLLTIPS